MAMQLHPHSDPDCSNPISHAHSGDVEREEALKKVLGCSAMEKCLMLVEIASQCESESGKVEILQVCRRAGIPLPPSWKDDTLSRYLQVGKKLGALPDVLQMLRKWEFAQGDQGAFYGITALRNLAGARLKFYVNLTLNFNLIKNVDPHCNPNLDCSVNQIPTSKSSTSISIAAATSTSTSTALTSTATSTTLTSISIAATFTFS